MKTNVGISYVGGVKNCDDPSPRASHLPVTGSTYTDMRHIHKPIYDTHTHTHTHTHPPSPLFWQRLNLKTFSIHPQHISLNNNMNAWVIFFGPTETLNLWGRVLNISAKS